MTIRPLMRRFGALLPASLALALATASYAQQSPPTTAPNGNAPPAVRIDPIPQPPAASDTTGARNDAGARSSDAPKIPGEAAEAAVGMAVFTSDGRRVGEVRSVKPAPDGKAGAIQVATGGFLGFGVKIVEIPAGKFAKSGRNVQLGMTYDEVSKLPGVAATSG